MLIVTASRKGGVGKTSMAILLAATYANRGVSVTLVDCDPQGSLTETLGYECSFDALEWLGGGHVSSHSVAKHINLISGGPATSGASVGEIDLMTPVVICDTQPGDPTITHELIKKADHTFAIATAHIMAVTGMSRIVDSFEMMEAEGGMHLILNQRDKRRGLDSESYVEIAQEWPQYPVSAIRVDAQFSKALNEGKIPAAKVPAMKDAEAALIRGGLI